ncbi:hypothetical protein [Hymenobacter negativus]|uniref:GGDEF domain-containing protein n=1 Tax=Hymenobacter negativus TaxID=2795026 RepID=A0ABS3QDT3_9BACT|nr:hypothetical protein [Hymenobacter negativus]MBO2009376.1 hypothetical protein [Hymenobacter negativus]
MSWLFAFMHASILAPMVVVWQRWQRLSAPMRLASWYVYVSGGSVIAGYLVQYFFHNNHLVIVGFNIGKLLLFAAVYRQVLAPTRWTELLRIALFGSLCGVGGLLLYDWPMAFTAARICQTTILTAYALLYLDQNLNAIPRRAANGSYSPIWLLSIGLLLGTAFTITASSLTLFDLTHYHISINAVFIIFSNTIFNGFLTLALLRSQADEVTLSATDSPLAALAEA